MKEKIRIVKVEDVSDADGKKEKHYMDNGLTAVVHSHPTQAFIDRIIKPQIECGNRVRKKEEYGLKVLRKMKKMAEKEIEKENG